MCQLTAIMEHSIMFNKDALFINLPLDTKFKLSVKSAVFTKLNNDLIIVTNKSRYYTV